MRQRPLIGSLAIGFLVLASTVQAMLTPVAVSNGYMGSVGRPSESAVAHAAGEFRIVAANLLWLNVVDHYHHQFMAQGGSFAKNVSLLPILRTITWLDPHFIQAYDVAGLILAETKRTNEGRKFLAEGIRNNENSWQLNYDVAMLYAWYDKDYASARPFAAHARDLNDDPYLKHRLDIFCRTLATANPPKDTPRG